MKFFKSLKGNFVVKRKARLSHECSKCESDISVNEEYYSVTYADEDGIFHTVTICEDCWSGNELSAENPRTYKEN